MSDSTIPPIQLNLNYHLLWKAKGWCRFEAEAFACGECKQAGRGPGPTARRGTWKIVVVRLSRYDLDVVEVSLSEGR